MKFHIIFNFIVLKLWVWGAGAVLRAAIVCVITSINDKSADEICASVADVWSIKSLKLLVKVLVVDDSTDERVDEN